MSDSDQAVTWRPRQEDDPLADLSVYEDSVYVEGGPAGDPTARLVSLGFLLTAIRRSRRLLCALMVIGLLLGLGFFVEHQVVYKANVSVLLVEPGGQAASDEILTDIALAQSLPVASGVIRQLGLKQTPTSFIKKYTVTEVTDQVLTLTVSAESSAESVQIASALATQFLDFRAQYDKDQQQLTESALNHQLSLVQQHLDSVNKQISEASSGSRTSLSSLDAQRTAANNALTQTEQYVNSALASTRSATQAMVQGSEILNNAVAVPVSREKTMVLYMAAGLFMGLIIGLVIIIIKAVTSDRLIRRDDISHVIGGSVHLSVGSLHASRWLPRRPSRRAARLRDRERFAGFLLDAVPESAHGPACLAVVAVDDAPTIARDVINLAVTSAKQGKRVALADFSEGSRAARCLGITSTGSNMADVDGMRILIIVPGADEIAPVGPVQNRDSALEIVHAENSLAYDCAQADFVFSLVTLNPATGSEHLATWSTEVVAVVTAGKSTATRIHAVGEMIRLAGVRLRSVVVLDADRSDESLGMTGSARAVQDTSF